MLINRLIVAALVVVVGIFATGYALGAEIEVKKRMTVDEHYILYYGQTKEGDADKLSAVLAEAQLMPTFNGMVALAGPGGSAQEAVLLAEVISENSLGTVAVGECYSACSLAWMAGGMDNRFIFEEGVVGFHFAYSQDAEWFNNHKELSGWIGIQDHIAQSSHFYTAQLLRWDVVDPAQFVYNLSIEGSAGSFFAITKDDARLQEVVGGKVWNDQSEN